jgi:putative FmdB family regulatory protein
MPTYEYVCRDCGHHLEVVQSFTDDPLQTCQRCQGQLRKVFSAAGIIFKGSGYYVTDTRASARKDGKSARKDGKSASSGAEGSSGGSSESSGSSSDSSSDTTTTESKSA